MNDPRTGMEPETFQPAPRVSASENGDLFAAKALPTPPADHELRSGLIPVGYCVMSVVPAPTVSAQDDSAGGGE